MRKTFKNRHIVERTKKAEIRPEDQSEKAERWENIWNNIQLRVSYITTETDTRTE